MKLVRREGVSSVKQIILCLIHLFHALAVTSFPDAPNVTTSWAAVNAQMGNNQHSAPFVIHVARLSYVFADLAMHGNHITQLHAVTKNQSKQSLSE